MEEASRPTQLTKAKTNQLSPNCSFVIVFTLIQMISTMCLLTLIVHFLIPGPNAINKTIDFIMKEVYSLHKVNNDQSVSINRWRIETPFHDMHRRHAHDKVIRLRGQRLNWGAVNAIPTRAIPFRRRSRLRGPALFLFVPAEAN